MVLRDLYRSLASGRWEVGVMQCFAMVFSPFNFFLHFCDLYYLGTVSAGKLGFIRLDTILYRSFSFLFYESGGWGGTLNSRKYFNAMTKCNNWVQIATSSCADIHMRSYRIYVGYEYALFEIIWTRTRWSEATEMERYENRIAIF